MTDSGRTPSALVEVRARLEEIDRNLILLVAARLEAADLAIRIRTEQGESICDPAQERRVIARARRWADEVGLPPALAETIFHAVIEAGKERAGAFRGRTRPIVSIARSRATAMSPGSSISSSERPSVKHAPHAVSPG